MPEAPVAVGVDVGGTKLGAVRVAADGTIQAHARIPSPSGPEALLAGLVEVVEQVVDGDGPPTRDTAQPAGAGDGGISLPVGVGFAGIITRDGLVRYGPNVDVTNLPLADRLAERLGVGAVVINDGSAAAWGEFRAGAARDVEDVVALTLGTGVGGGIVSHGRLVEGANGFAAELGHLIVEDGGRRCPCGNRGCLEAYSSGTAIALAAREQMRAVPGEAGPIRDALRERLGGDVAGETTSGGEASAASGAAGTGDPPDFDAVRSEDVAAAAAAGDPLAQEILTDAGHWLGVGLATLVNALDPGRIVIGGGAVAGVGERVLPVARKVMTERVMGREHRQLPDVVRAALGNQAGAVGAALRAAEVTGG